MKGPKKALFLPANTGGRARWWFLDQEGQLRIVYHTFGDPNVFKAYNPHTSITTRGFILVLPKYFVCLFTFKVLLQLNVTIFFARKTCVAIDGPTNRYHGPNSLTYLRLTKQTAPDLCQNWEKCSEPKPRSRSFNFSYIQSMRRDPTIIWSRDTNEISYICYTWAPKNSHVESRSCEEKYG